MGRLAKSVHVCRPEKSAERMGVQAQLLTPCITRQVCGAERISAGTVNMPPGVRAKAHYHAHNEIIVYCLHGHIAALIGPEMTPYFHNPGEFIYIPEGVVHVAVNLSETESATAVEIRTDPLFNDDVVLTPEHEDGVDDIVARLRAELAKPVALLR
jgi:uncharacterized RmlC-like cupin family protein